MSINNIFVVLRIVVLLILLNPVAIFAKSSAIVNPCGVITLVEADEIMGEKMKSGQLREQKAIGMKLCLYEPEDSNSFAMLQVSILQGQRAQEIFLEIKKNFPDHEMVDGIGDDAFIASPGIHILKDDYYITIAAGNLNRNKDKVLVAGKKAVANLEAELK